MSELVERQGPNFVRAQTICVSLLILSSLSGYYSIASGSSFLGISFIGMDARHASWLTFTGGLFAFANYVMVLYSSRGVAYFERIVASREETLSKLTKEVVELVSVIRAQKQSADMLRELSDRVNANALRVGPGANVADMFERFAGQLETFSLQVRNLKNDQGDFLRLIEALEKYELGQSGMDPPKPSSVFKEIVEITAPLSERSVYRNTSNVEFLIREMNGVVASEAGRLDDLRKVGKGYDALVQEIDENARLVIKFMQEQTARVDALEAKYSSYHEGDNRIMAEKLRRSIVDYALPIFLFLASIAVRLVEPPTPL
ncbi:MAG: hypothetical protein ACU0CO_07275 [Shimia sp.]